MPDRRPSPSSEVQAGQSAGFGATHWSVVLAAGGEDSPARQAALETLCRSYWGPICGYLRRKGNNVTDAQDLTQSFFTHLLTHSWFSKARPGLGRFRGFLLVSLKHFLINEAQRNRAARRGGRVSFVPLDENHTAKLPPSHDGCEETADRWFDREWALAVMQHAFERLKEDWNRQGKLAQFERLSVFLSRGAGAEDYVELGRQLGMRPKTVPVVLHRLRRGYRELVRGEVAQTVSTRAEVDAETRYLLELACQ